MKETASRLAFKTSLASVHGMVTFRVTGWVILGLCLFKTPLLADKLSPLAHAPRWSELDAYRHTITRTEFTRLMNQIYSPDGTFWNFAAIDDAKVVLFSDVTRKQPVLTLQFAPSEATCAPRPFPYLTKGTSSEATRPLKGLKIALDPGHIGGDWAKLEARYFKLGDDPPVEEAKLNLITCRLLAERLEADGAEIVWAKQGYEPTTHLRPEDLHREAIAALAPAKSGNAASSLLFGLPDAPLSRKQRNEQATLTNRVDNEAALLFYRVAEIRARAELVNKLHPDLTICVHYNADDWGDPDRPELIGQSRLVIFLNGAYEKSELTFDDMRYDLLRKLLDRDADAEEKGCALVGRQMLETLKYPPEKYTGYFARHVTDVPSVYARNLLASRLYHGPVIYCEGPYMNARDAYYRIIAGDYLGLRTIQGQSCSSVYRDYASAVEQGVLKYFAP